MNSFRRSLDIARGAPSGLAAIREQARSLYRNFLRQSERLSDPVLAHYVRERTRERFRRHSDKVSYEQCRSHLAEARKYNRKLKRAVAGERKDYQWLIQMSYGLKGRLSHLWQMNDRNTRKSSYLERCVSRPVMDDDMALDKKSQIPQCLIEHLNQYLRWQTRTTYRQYAYVLPHINLFQAEDEEAVNAVLKRMRMTDSDGGKEN